MTGPDTPEQVVQSLAQHFDDAGDTKAALRKVWLAHLEYLRPLRASAADADLDSFHTISAWYLTPSYLFKYKDHLAAGDLNRINISRRIGAIKHILGFWGAGAISNIRYSLRERLPLPSTPNRDFLEELAKIAAAQYKLRAFLQDLPPFIDSRLHLWRLQDPHYHHHEKQPCLQRKHLKAFWQDKFVPDFLQNGKAVSATQHPAKRQKTAANTRSTRSARVTAAPDDNSAPRDEIEVSRRADAQELPVDDSIIRYSSPTVSIDLSQHASVSINRTTGGESELLIDDDEAGVTFLEQEEPIETETRVNTMPRRGKQAQNEARVTRDVQEKYDDFVRQFGMNPALHWLIETAKQRAVLAEKKAAVDATLTAAEDAIEQLEQAIHAELPPGKTLGEARSEAHEDLENTKLVYSRILSLKQAAQDLLPDMADAGLQSSAQFQFTLDEPAVAAVKVAREKKLKDFDDIAEDLRKKQEDRREKEDEYERLEEQYARLDAEQENMRAFFNLRQDQPTFAALARLSLPSDE